MATRDSLVNGQRKGTSPLFYTPFDPSSSSFVERKENVIFLGPPGVGKTHLALSLAIAAAQHGRRVYYATLSDLITSLEEA